MPKVKVTLVDGVGHPKVIDIEEQSIFPITIPFPHPQRGAREAQVIVKFDRSNGEEDPMGRQIYRMRGSGLPALRAAYLLLQALPKPKRPPAVGSTGE